MSARGLRSRAPAARREHACHCGCKSDAVTAPIPDHAHDILRDKPTGFLACHRRDGSISVTPVGLLFDGEHVRVSTTTDRKKYERLLRDPRMTLCVPHRNNPNRYVEIQGTAVITRDPDRTFVDATAKVYMGVDRYPFDQPGQERVVITIEAQRVSAPKIPLADAPPNAPD
jgi:PPOX class probable F420-dependent enzyme